MDLMLVPIGFLVGALVGLTGVGGGAVMTPALILFGVPPATAVGTDLVYAAITKSQGVLVHQLRGNVCWPLVAALSAGSLPSAALTLWLLGVLGETGVDIGGVVTPVLGVALVSTAVVVLLRPRIPDFRRCSDLTSGAITVAGGAVIGTLVAASSVGAGALGAALLLGFHRRLPIGRVVGTDLAHALLLAILAGAGHWSLGNVDGGTLWPLLFGSLPGVYLGVGLGRRLPDGLLSRVMAFLLLALGIGFSLSAVWH